MTCAIAPVMTPQLPLSWVDVWLLWLDAAYLMKREYLLALKEVGL